MTATNIGLRSHRVPVVHKTGYLIATYSHNERAREIDYAPVDPFDGDEQRLSEQAAALMAKIMHNAAMAGKS